MFDIQQYRIDNFPFPNHDIDPKLKEEPEYGIQYCKAIYSLWLKNQTAWGYDVVDYFNRVRKYSDGMQDVSQYQSFLKVEEPASNESISIWDTNDFTRTAKRAGYHALIFQNLSPAPKILNAIHGLMDDVDYDIMADTIDADSRGLIDFMKYVKLHEAMDVKWQTDFKKRAGIPIDEPTNFPKTKEELDAFEAREGFKLNVAKSMQKLLRYSFADSEWADGHKWKVIDDLVTSKYATAIDVFDDETQTFKMQWLDPAKTVIQYSHEQDYHDSEHAGYFRLETISNVRRKCPWITEEELIKLAKNYKGRAGNPNRWYERYSHLDAGTRGYGFDDWKICVFTAYWIDFDKKKSIYWKGKGNERIIPIGHESKVKPLTNGQVARGFKQDIKTTTIRQVYQCSWILDSDIAFDFGKYHMAARPELTKPKLPIHAVQLLQQSIIYRLIPIFDHIAIAWLQFQNDLANMVQRGYAINMAMLMNVVMNGKDLDPANVLSLWKQKGLLPYMPSPTGNYTGGMALPITPIDGGLGDRVQQVEMQLNMYYKEIENIIGINPLTLGATPDNNAPVGTTEVSIRATSNVLKPIMTVYHSLKKSLAESTCLRIQIGLRVSEDIRKAYAGIVNPNDIRTMIMAEQSGTKYGILLHPRPNDQERMTIIRYMEIAIQQGQITPPDAMYFSERIQSGADITEIRQEIAYAIQKEQERAAQAQQANIDRQNQGLQQLEGQKNQSLAIQTQLEGKSKIMQENERARSKANLLRLTNNYKMLADAQAQVDAEAGLITPNNTGK